MGPALFAISLEAMKSEIDEVQLQGIEFWSNVCDEEVDLAIEAADVSIARIIYSCVGGVMVMFNKSQFSPSAANA